MAVFKKTAFEVMVLGMLGIAIGFGANVVRGSGSIKSTKDYFAAPNRLHHEYQVASFDEVVAIFNHPDTEMGLNVFIDARNVDHYEDGHIPGAIQCFPFEIEKCIDDVMQYAEPADKIVVYCNGGDCEDSIWMCRELIEAGLAYEQIRIYEGGWEEWTARNQAVEEGQ